MLLSVGFFSGISGADFPFTLNSLQSSRAFPEQQFALHKAFPQQPLAIHPAEQDCTTALHQNCLQLLGNTWHSGFLSGLGSFLGASARLVLSKMGFLCFSCWELCWLQAPGSGDLEPIWAAPG